MQTSPKNSNRITEKSNDSLNDLMSQVLQKATALGATDAMVSVNHDQGFSVDVRMKEVESVAFSEDKGVNLVVYIGHRKGEASSTDTSPQALEKLVEAACDIAKVSAEDPCFGLADASLMREKYPELELYYPWDINPQEAIEKALACESQALSLDSRITNSDGVNVSTFSHCLGFANTKGGKGFIRNTRHSLSCSLVAQQKESMQRDYDYTVSRDPNQLMALDALAKSAVERTTSRLGAKQIKTQKTPVLFTSRVSSSLFSSFIRAISGGSLYRKNSFLLNCLNQKIFPSNINIYEQPHLLGALGSSPFDDEGVLTRNNVFVENGILSSYILGSYTARKLGLETTANAGGVHNLTIAPTAGELKDLIKQMDKGLIITELMGQGVNILTGDYSRGAAGFWVENGEIKNPVDSITIAGNLKTMFQSMLAVGKDINPNVALRCGSVLIEEMMVAGH